MKNLYRLTDQKLLDLYDAVLFRMEVGYSLGECPVCYKYYSSLSRVECRKCPAAIVKRVGGETICGRWCRFTHEDRPDPDNFLIEIAWPIEAELAMRGLL